MSEPTVLNQAHQVSTGSLGSGFLEWIGLSGIDLNSTFIAGLLGAGFGAIISGIISYLLQRKEHKRAEQIRAGDRNTERKAIAYTLLTKMMVIHSVTSTTTDYLEEVAARAETDSEFPEPWQTYHPIVTHLPAIEFSPEERGLIYSLSDNELLNDVLMCDYGYLSTIGLVAKLNEKHDGLTAELPARMEGMRGHIRLGENEVLKFRPKMMILNNLFSQTLEWCAREKVTTAVLLMRLGKVLKEEVGIDKRPEILSTEEQAKRREQSG